MSNIIMRDIDDVDLKIMEILINEPRITLTDIHKLLRMPISTIWDRMNNISAYFSLKGYWVLSAEGKDLIRMKKENIAVLEAFQNKTGEVQVVKADKVKKNGKKKSK